MLDDLDEAAPETGSWIVLASHAACNQRAQHRLAGARERLARRPSGNEVNVMDPPGIQMVEELVSVMEIPDVAESPKVGRMRLDGSRVQICASQDAEACITKS
jgi:hypothetical protein